MSITAEAVKKLREATGAGMMDAKKALEETNGDMDAAVEYLRKAGQKIAAKKADRSTGEGIVGMYVHSNGKIAAMVKVLCETDFVARTDDFKALANDLAMQVAAMNPQYITSDEVPQDVKDKELSIYKEEMKESGKPEDIIQKIAEGKLDKYYSDVCLMKQSFIKDDKLTIEKWFTEMIAKLGENIQVTEFHRFSI
ncbi:MAG: translation elongation factor Ts [Patescibacteria group bacterium]